MSDERPPFPPFDEDSAWAKVLGAEAAWNTRDPERVALAYTEDSVWRNRDTFLQGRDEIRDFLAATDLSKELQKALTSLSFEIRTEIRFIPNEAGGVRPEVKAKVDPPKRKARASEAPPADEPDAPTDEEE